MNKNALINAVLEYKAELVVDLVNREIENGTDYTAILNDALLVSMDEVGERFSRGDIFLPEMMMAAKAVQDGLEVLRPLLTGRKVKPRGKVVLGTVKGDLHDIGKNLVAMMLKGGGFEVIDLGVDVDADRFVSGIKENDADIVGISALLTTTMSTMEETVTKIHQQNLPVKTMIGGAPVTQVFADKIGADGYSPDAPGAVRLAKEWLL